MKCFVENLNVCMRRLMQLDNDTDKKLLFTNAVSPVLHGNQMFLALSDKMDRFNRPFFLLPHTTRVI